jgi:hypothetical protein
VGGALLDAAVDRYGEFFILAGLAVLFHESIPMLALVLLALAAAPVKAGKPLPGSESQGRLSQRVS